jgi:signal transduction histidine kinase/ActR/RegA family two-component response regulator
MQLKQIASIEGRLVLLVWGLLALGILVYAGADLHEDYRQLMERTREEMLTEARIVAYTVGPAVTFETPEGVREGLESAFLLEGITYAGVFTDEGERLESLGEPRRFDCQMSCHVTTDRTDYVGREALVLHTPVFSPDQEIVGCLVLQRSLADIWAGTRRTLLRTLIYLCVLLIAGFVGALLLAKRISQPLRQLAEAAREFCDDMSPEAVPDGGSIHETRVLAQAFREMMERIREHRRRIEEQNRTLEAKVLERTEELRQKNLALAFQNEKVMEANRLKSQFLANMSHELRTPLNGILALSEMLKEEMMGPLSPEQKEQVEIIHRSGQTLLALINEILDLSKVESGRLELKPRRVRIVSYLKKEAETLRPLAESKGLTYEVVASDEEEPEVLVDPQRVRQVMVNLIGNAVKFTEKGSVRVILERIQGGSRLRVTVQDTGVGIPREHHATVFQEFRQLDGSASRKHGGTGLGLAICKKLVQLMGGEIWLDSEVGRGSTFSFVIPLKVREGTEAPAPHAPAPVSGPSGPKRILIVEDDQVEAALLARRLHERGHHAIAVGTAEEAVRRLREGPVDLVVLDLILPKMDGEAFLRELEMIPGADGVPVLVSTAKDLSPEEREAFEKRGCTVFLKAETGMDRLVEEICRRLASEEAQDSSRAQAA